MTIIKRLVLAFLATCLLSCGLLCFVVTTEAGLRCLITLSNALAGTLFSIGSSSGTLLGPLQLRQIRFTDGVDTVLIDTVQLDWSPGQLLDGRISLQSLLIKQVRVMLGKTSEEASEETVLPAFSLPLPVFVDTLQMDDIRFSSAGEDVQRLESVGGTHLRYQGDRFGWSECILSWAGNKIHIKGEVQTNAEYLVKATVNAHLFFEEYAPIVATVTLSGPLKALKIAGDTQQPLLLHLDGELRDVLGHTSWSATASSPEVVLPVVNAGWPDQRFRHVSLQGQGTLEEYRLKVDAETGVPGLSSPVALAAEVLGNDRGLAFSRLIVTHNAAMLSAQGRLQWSPFVAWQADIQGTRLDPSVVFPQWPGQFSGRLTTEGERDQSLQAHVQLTDLKGILRGYPLAGTGSMDLRGDHLSLHGCTLQSGGSLLEIKGSSAPAFDLDLRLYSKNLAEVFPNAAGSLEAKAHLGGTLQKPELDLRIEGNRLGCDRHTIGHFHAAANGLIATDGLLTATLQLDRAILAGLPLEKAVLDLRGSLANHSLKLTAANSEMKTGGELQGRYAAGKWQGTLQHSRFSFTGWGDWRQQKRSELLLSPSRMELATTCLGTAPGSTVCVNGTWNGGKQPWQFQANVTDFPLAALAYGLSAPWPIQGTLNSTLQVQGNEQRISHAHFSAETDNLQLTTPRIDGQHQQLTWHSNSLRGAYENNQLSLSVSSFINEQNALRADIRQRTADPVGDFLTRPLQGTLRLNMQDLTFISVLSNQAVIPSGALQGEWTIEGPLLSPRLSGAINLTDGKAELPALGITLSPFHLSMKGDAKEVGIEAVAHSGSGELHATSTLDLGRSDRRAVRIHLVGKNFHAVKLPGMDLTLSPDVVLAAGEKEVKVQGRINIPKAQVTSINFDQAAAPSVDVVVIDEGPDATVADQPLYLDLDILTGEDVKVDAYGLRGTIKGNLHLDGQPGRPLIGTGTLSVHDGTFRLYGKQLKIDVGRMVYTGGPLTNPGVELRSERKTDKSTTGVTIEGFLQHPELSFYSTPAMEQSAIIQNLLEDTAIGGETREDIGMVGTAAKKIGLDGLVPYLQSLKKMSMIDEIKLESGDDSEDRSLVFGSWLTPDLYVSYGKDLAKESGMFNTKLNLGHGFSLFTEAGASQSGGDIKYEFEYEP